MPAPVLVGGSPLIDDPTFTAPSLTVPLPGARRYDLVIIFSFQLDLSGTTTSGPTTPAGFNLLAYGVGASGGGVMYWGWVEEPILDSVTILRGSGMPNPSAWLVKGMVIRGAAYPGNPIEDFDAGAASPNNTITTPVLTAAGVSRLAFHFLNSISLGDPVGPLAGIDPYTAYTEHRVFGANGFGTDILIRTVSGEVEAQELIYYDNDPTQMSLAVYSLVIAPKELNLLPAVPDPRNLSFRCAESYTCWITDADLETRIDSFPWSSLSWERVLDDLSSASAMAPDVLWGAYCSANLGGVEPWRHGLLIERNDQEVWRGPITGLGRPRAADGRILPFVEIRADDPFAWYVKRPSTWAGPVEFDDVDSGYIFRQIIMTLAKLPSDRWTLDCPDVGVDEALKRTLRWEDQETAWSVISELMDASVDAFIMNGILYVWSPDEGWVYWRERNRVLDGPYNQNLDFVYGSFTEQSFSDPPGWDIDGYNQANYFSVPAADTGELGFRKIYVAQDANSQARYGVLWDRDPNPLHKPADEEPAIADSVFQARADTSVALQRVPPAVLSGGALANGAPVDIDNLRPGSIWMMDIYDAGFVQGLTAGRLKRVAVDVQMTEQGLVERVTPTVYPIGWERGTTVE